MTNISCHAVPITKKSICFLRGLPDGTSQHNDFGPGVEGNVEINKPAKACEIVLESKERIDEYNKILATVSTFTVHQINFNC